MADYPDDIKARCLAALLAGQSPALVAREYRIPVGTIYSWKSRQQHGGDSPASLARESRERIGALLITYLETTIDTLIMQQEVFRDAEWLRKQSAAELATLHGISIDKAVRLFEAIDESDDPMGEDR